MKTAIKYVAAFLLLTLAFPMLARADEAAPGDSIARFVGTTKGSGWGMPAMVLIVNMPPDSTQLTRIVVPNEIAMGPYDPNHMVMKHLAEAKPGDLLIIKTETDGGTTAVAKIGNYDPKPGEDEPGSFLFMEANTDGEHPTVTLSRFLQVGILPVAQKRDDSGKMVPDPDVLAAIKSFSKGDVVIAKLKPGRVPALASIELYTAPLKGEFVKLTTAAVDGQPHPAIEVNTDAGVDTTIVLPGTTSKSGKFTPDPDLFRAVHHMRAKTQIEYRTTTSGDQTILKDIAPAKAAPSGS